jgi:hypothetical protein
MLDLELSKSFQIHIKLPKTEQNVNDLVGYCKKISKIIFQQLFDNIILKIQRTILDHYLGLAWKRNHNRPTPWTCPRCHSRFGFHRRGKRKRTLLSSNGSVSFSLLQVTCNDCGKTFSPFPTLLGIRSRHRLTKEFEQLLCTVVKDTSFAKTARTCNLFTNLNLSSRTVHKTVQTYGQKAHIVEDLTHMTQMQTDSTKIKATQNQRGIDVHLTLSIGPSHKRGKRVHREKTLAAIEVAKSPKKAKKLLENSTIDELIVDGRSGLEGFIEKKKIPVVIQRCLWHIPHTAIHMLMQDGLRKSIGRELVRPMKQFLFDEKIAVEQRLAKYDTLIAQFQDNDYESACTFLRNAREKLFAYKQFDDHDLYGKTNSVVERQMRELNRRMENGSKWTIPGAQNLLNLKFIEELNPISYDYLWKIRKSTKASFQVILC